MKKFDENGKLTEAALERMAHKVRKWLLKNGMWVDIKIYYNGKSIGTYDYETKKFYYDEDKYYEKNPDKPQDYFHVPEDTPFAMSFEGVFCHFLSYGVGRTPAKLQSFKAIFEEYGLKYMINDHWNLYTEYINK